MPASFTRFFFNHLELIFSVAGLFVIWLVPVLFDGSSFDTWAVAAITATAVGVLHGGIFWVVRQRQRRVRSRAIWEIREMLEDRVRNQLAVVQMYLPTGPEAEAFAFEMESIRESVDTISSLVTSLDERALEAWKGRYTEALAQAEKTEQMALAG